MARPTKKGLDYFPLDVGFFGDKNIRILKARYRSDGIAVYIKLLCDVYKEGYFLPVERWEDYIFVIADEIGATPDKVEQVILFLQAHAMVRIFRRGKDELTGLDVDAVITSHGIQKRYAAAMKSRRKKSVNEVKRGFWLLTEEEEKEINAFYKCGINEGFSEKNSDISDNNPDLSRDNPIKESKIKEKEIISTDVPRERLKIPYFEKDEHAKAYFFARFPALKCTPDIDDSLIDYKHLAACFDRSKKHLQTRHYFPWVVAHYEEIIDGKYDDFPETLQNAQNAKPAPTLSPAVQAANARAARDQFYAWRRNSAEARAERVYKRAMQSPEFSQAVHELRKLDIEIPKAEIQSAQDVPELKRRKKILQDVRAKALADLGLTEQDLLTKWYCPKCSDTGFLPNGAMCDCYNVEQSNGRGGDTKTT